MRIWLWNLAIGSALVIGARAAFGNPPSLAVGVIVIVGLGLLVGLVVGFVIAICEFMWRNR